MKNIILASASPRRRELLKNIFDEFEVIPADVDESISDEVDIDLRAQKIAERKARYIAEKFPDSLVIGCDTAVILGDKMLGKPSDRQDAEKMLRSLSGKIHKVITGCCLCERGKEQSFSAVTEVEFYELGENELKKYLDTNDWADKAGAYGIQNGACVFVKKINGCYNNVVGLPVAMLNREIIKFSGDK
ncbi:MAG: Maf family protein [Ruminococcus sp.]|nr:Maf family protein [Ruminococcus sp.]